MLRITLNSCFDIYIDYELLITDYFFDKILCMHTFFIRKTDYIRSL
jgi:hypothetical protein